MIRENCLYSVNHFNKTLIGQAGSIGGKARQEVGVEQRDWEYSSKQEAPPPPRSSAQTTREERCKLAAPLEKGLSHVADVDKDNGVT